MIERDDWFLTGQWGDITILAVDSWNGKFNNIVMKELLGKWAEVVQVWKDNKIERMYYSKSCELEMAHLAKEKFLADPECFHKIMEFYSKKRKEILERIDEIEKINLTELSNDEIIVLFIETRKHIGYCGGYDWLPFSFDNKILEAVDLNQYVKDHPNEESFILACGLPENIMPTLEEEIEILQIAQKTKGLSKEDILSQYKDELKELIRKYKHISALILYPFKTEEKYAEQIYEESKNENLTEELKEKKEYTENIHKKVKEYTEKHNPPKEIIQSIKAIQKLSEIRATGELDALYCFSRSRKLDEEIQKRLDLSKEDYFNLFIEEVISLLKKENLNIDFEQRKKLVVFYRDAEGASAILENGNEFLEKLQKEVKQDSELKGMPGCPGKATGTVKLIFSSNDVNKFKEGDILVAPSTCVDYVIIMKKAAAIVTEFGGITSHAAVVSRELNVPSIIAVPNVTKILKEGDQVEVDAYTGIVKKI